MSQHIEWLNLIDRSGAFLEPGVLDDALPQGLEGVDSEHRRNLLSAYDEWREAVDACDADAEALHRAWIDFVLKAFLEYDDRALRRGESVPESLSLSVAEHGGIVRPGMAVMKGDSPQLLIDVLPPDTDLESIRSYEGWNTSALDRMIALCRGAKVTIGLLTNGERWLVVHVPEGGTVGHASWYGRIWRPEPVTLRAFQTLLGVRRCFGPQDKTLPALLAASLEYQDEVTDTLGQQVRRAVEVLIQSLDRADHDRHGELLRDVEPRELYEAGLTVMMRFVFLMCAEERGLLLLGEGIYDQNYAISTLRSELREWQSRHGDQVLERRHDAWSRLLATFRAVFGGVTHETLRMPALGGSLFDPDRFPFLEGRPKGSSWRQSIATPLPIDNRTVLLLLSSLQVLEQRRGARLLSYKALDVEQIGHVYEGLLECTVQRLPEITLGLEGASSAKDPNLSLVDLERAQQEGEASVLALLTEVTARSESALRRAMGREVEEAFESRLLLACGSETELLRRVKPWANLLRKDIWDHPLVYRREAFAVTLGSDRRETGTHYTPKSLTEQIVRTTLEPLVYTGPSDGKPREEWILKKPQELLDLKVCDPAMGSGAFLVQVCRYLGDRLVESWGLEEVSGKAITVDGEVVDRLDSSESMPIDPEERIILARRLLAERCLYGVDINPMAVELAKLSIWLVTLAKGRPFGFLDHNLKCGDSLLGIHRLEQLANFSMNPTGEVQGRLFGQGLGPAIQTAIELRSRLREIPIRDIHDVEAMRCLDIDARCRLEVAECMADALIGEIVAANDNNAVIEKTMAWLAIQAEQVIDGDREILASLRIRSIEALSFGLPHGKVSRRPFHWPLEFPEIFPNGFDAIVGNPPFLKGTAIGKSFGACYRSYIGNFVGEGKKASYADLCAFFILRALTVTKSHGVVGMIATNTISQGDTREMGLDQIFLNNSKPYWVKTDIKWSGSANVIVSVVIIRKDDGWNGIRILNEKEVVGITKFLTEGCDEIFIPQKLVRNKDIAFKGSTTGCKGFVLESKEAEQIIANDNRYSEVIQKFIGGQDFNSSPQMTTDRWVINFKDWTYEQASQFPICINILKERVKPYFDSRTGQIHETDFWKFSDKRLESYKSISKFNRVLFHAFTSKHLAFGFVGTGMVYSAPHVVIALQGFEHFAVLQSSFHMIWVLELCSTMGVGIRYAPSDLLETFPFPSCIIGDKKTESSTACLSSHGEKYYKARSKFMEEQKIGLTDFYNIFHNKNENGSDISEIRKIQTDIDYELCNLYSINIDLNHNFVNTKIGIRYLPEGGTQKLIFSKLAELNQQIFKTELREGMHSQLDSTTSTRATRSRLAKEPISNQPSLGLEINNETLTHGMIPGATILSFLHANNGWWSKSEIIAANNISDGQWNVAIADLIARGLVERQGERRGARYRGIEVRS
ncbi:MAG: hypothetical protein LWW79_07650 [Holophagaceae bacterium]|nr:hypothetical protein [Holophagaceae bacterium]